MKIESLNCPNCGAEVSSDRTQCQFCRSRLKTMACGSCLGLMFDGTRFCGHCGKRAVETQNWSEKDLGSCPRCRVELKLLQIEEITLRECQHCDGLWVDVETFEEVCANLERQAVVLRIIGQNPRPADAPKVQYIPCPDCKNLMNRSNFARSSGVIVDICKQHGIWFDAKELPRIIEFIRRGGLDRQREKEKLQLEEQIRNLTELQREAAREESGLNRSTEHRASPSAIAVREFVRFLFD